MQSSTKTFKFNLSCPDNDAGNTSVHCNIGLMPGGEAKLTSFDVSRAILFNQQFGYLTLDI